MQRDSDGCEYCGTPFIQLNADTPIVNRYARDFHLNLNSIPGMLGPWQVGYFFSYVRHEHLPPAFRNFPRALPKELHVQVVMPNLENDPQKVLLQVEVLADQLAEMLDAGQGLADRYTFTTGTLTPGFPK